MYQFFVTEEQIIDGTVTITGTDVNHIKNVLRMETGEQVVISNGQDQKEYRCRIESFEADCVKLDIMWVEEKGLELPSKLYLFQGLPKNDKMEFIIQKAVELGVYEVIPVASKRAVVKLDAKREASKMKRWQQIAESAAKQSKRMIIPNIHSVLKWEEALAYASQLDIKLIPYELAENMSHTKELIGSIQKGQSVGIFIGPEGGFEEGEVEKAISAGVLPITLGKRILRTETAGMTILSIIMYQLEE